MNKIYNNQEEIASKIGKFLQTVCTDIRKTQLNILPYILFGMIIGESCVSGDIAKSLKGHFSTIQYDSVVRRIRRFFNNALFEPYEFYKNVIKYVISHYKIKHKDNTIHIAFDHMYSKENYTIFMLSMRVGKQGIPLYFKCFKGIRQPDAFSDQTITEAIKEVSSYFENTNFNLVFLADRWFNSEKILRTIDELGHIYCIRFKSNLKVLIYDKKEKRYVYSKTGDLTGWKYKGKYYKDVYLYENSAYKTNIAISKSDSVDEPWIIVSNKEIKRSIKWYGYRFGIECVFKNQKSNGFYIEKICNASLKGFTTMYACVCFCITFLTIIGADFSKNTRCYKKVKITTHKKYNGIKKRIVSLFNTGLILFKLAHNSLNYIRIPFKFILQDI